LEKNISWADMVHLHGTYSPMNIRVGRMCESLKTPYVVTLHGGLAPQGARLRGFIKKKVFHRLFQKEHLERASAVHVLTEEESTDLFALAQPHRVFCIPNGIDLDDYPKEFHENRTSPGKIKIGYIGRLSPEKNLDALCQAVAKLGGLFDVSLQLVGPVSDYGSKVLSRYPDSKIRLLGPMYGRDKYQFLSDIDLLVIPSLTEGFSIVIAESLALETPVLVTRTSKMTYFYDRKAFFMCEPTAFGLSNGLQRAFQARGDWHLITANGRRLVEELFNWNAISARMLDAYRSV
jgi:glycosyltransferase involved in cell wall biosynthesis